MKSLDCCFVVAVVIIMAIACHNIYHRYIYLTGACLFILSDNFYPFFYSHVRNKLSIQ